MLKRRPDPDGGPEPWARRTDPDPWSGAAPGPAPRGRARTVWRLRDLLLVLLVGAGLSIVLIVPAAVMTFSAGSLLERDVSVPVWFAVLGSAGYVALWLAVWLMVVERRRVPWSAIGFRRVGPGLLLAMVPAGFVLLILNILLILPVTFFLGLGDPDAANSQDQVFDPNGGMTGFEALLLAIPLVVLAPIVEEILFRGLLYRYLRGRLGVVLAVLLSALIFAVLHAVIPPLFLMGILLAILAQRSGSLLPGIVLHATNNALVVLAIWLAANAG